jgi:hypothetical protein
MPSHYYPEGSDTPDAPWNEADPEPRECMWCGRRVDTDAALCPPCQKVEAAELALDPPITHNKMHDPVHFTELTPSELEAQYQYLLRYIEVYEKTRTSATTHALIAACKSEFERRQAAAFNL